ncbi:hypothetical protein EYZ11_010502 [Aspergillus tanneri]|uniref:Uncharacterized protein n=1 Tax=Aspergillus tanneri TaxID=1220188 RepID=A0A4S3J557_9EURO|nr:hypothetical protein EYZ11_010502 [Aspergillus tanneri]
MAIIQGALGTGYSCLQHLMVYMMKRSYDEGPLTQTSWIYAAVFVPYEKDSRRVQKSPGRSADSPAIQRILGAESNVRSTTLKCHPSSNVCNPIARSFVIS